MIYKVRNLKFKVQRYNAGEQDYLEKFLYNSERKEFLYV